MRAILVPSYRNFAYNLAMIALYIYNLLFISEITLFGSPQLLEISTFL